MKPIEPALVLMRAVLLAVGLAALPGCASLSSEPDPTQVRLDDIDRRLGGVERVVNNQSMVELAKRNDQLTAEVRALRGQIEELQNAQEQLKTQQRSLYADLDKRIGGTATQSTGSEAATSASPPVPARAPTATTPATIRPATVGPAATTQGGAPSNAAAQQRYGAAFDALKAGNYAAAISGFGGFLRDYPTNALADNAQYWLGEAYYVTRDYERALIAFTRVGQQWPDSRKAPDAQLKLGYTQFELKRYSAARATLADVSSRWPGSEAARLAQERLKRLPAPPP